MIKETKVRKTEELRAFADTAANEKFDVYILENEKEELIHDATETVSTELAAYIELASVGEDHRGTPFFYIMFAAETSEEEVDSLFKDSDGFRKYRVEWSR